jgi:hypothetical protein
MRPRRDEIRLDGWPALKVLLAPKYAFQFVAAAEAALDTHFLDSYR